MTRLREWLSIELISLGLWVMPYIDFEMALRRSINRTVDEFLDE